MTVCHHLTREVALHSRAADAVLIAVGKSGLLKGDMIRPGAAVIDIGINQVEGAEGALQVVGDCDYDSCENAEGLPSAQFQLAPATYILSEVRGFLPSNRQNGSKPPQA